MNRTPWAPAFRSRARQDEGIALLVVIALIGIVTMFFMIMVAVAIRESNASGRDRQRAVAVMTAEGQIDGIIAQVQGTPRLSLPCDTAIAATVQSTKMNLTNKISYYDSSGPLTCPAVQGGAAATTARIASTSVSIPIAGQSPAVRTIETLLKLTPKYNNDLDKAIFGNAGLDLGQNVTIKGAGGAYNADLYSNGNVNCGNNEQFFGSIYAQGTFTMANQCNVEVNAYAKGGFLTSNSNGPRVGGKIESSQGSVELGKTTVGQTAQAKTTVTGDICSTVGKCIGGQTLSDPPIAAFPQIVWDAATQLKWETAGFTNVVSISPCTSGQAEDWLVANASSLPADTILRTTCRFSLTKDVKLSKNIVIVGDRGFDFAKSDVASTNATVRNLYLIQPYNTSCTSPSGINISNQTNVATTIAMLFYTPCDINKRNNSDIIGQMYGGGTVSISNLTTMTYESLPTWGVFGSTSISNYDVDILYKRETLG